MARPYSASQRRPGSHRYLGPGRRFPQGIPICGCGCPAIAKINETPCCGFHARYVSVYPPKTWAQIVEGIE